MSVSLRVAGAPGGCRRTARQLTRTSHAVADTADFLLRERHQSVQGLDGGTGLAYRERVATTAREAELLSRCVAELGRRLGGLADALEDVEDRIELARRLVARYDLVRGDRLTAPVDRADEDARLVRERRLAHREAVAIVRRARADEAQAQDGWRATLTAYAIDLGQSTWNALPSGTFLPPVEDLPARPEHRPERRAEHPRERDDQAPDGGAAPLPGPLPGPPDGHLERHPASQPEGHPASQPEGHPTSQPERQPDRAEDSRRWRLASAPVPTAGPPVLASVPFAPPVPTTHPAGADLVALPYLEVSHEPCHLDSRPAPAP